MEALTELKLEIDGSAIGTTGTDCSLTESTYIDAAEVWSSSLYFRGRMSLLINTGYTWACREKLPQLIIINS